MPEYGPQLIKTVLGSTLLDSMIIGVIKLRTGQVLAAGAVDDPEEAEEPEELDDPEAFACPAVHD